MRQSANTNTYPMRTATKRLNIRFRSFGSKTLSGPYHLNHRIIGLRRQQGTVLYLYSEVQMLAIRLPQSIEKRLEKLARRTGRTKSYYVREAILQHLEDLEDVYLAEGALERIRSGEEETIPLKDALKRHGLQR